MPKLSLKQQVEQQISRTKQDVFLRADFEQLGGYDQVGRALRELVTEGKLLKIGYGLYAKARSAASRVNLCWRLMVVLRQYQSKHWSD